MLGIGNRNQNLQITWQNMKYLYFIGLVLTLAMCSEEPQIEVEQELEHATKLHDSALLMLKDISKANDSLVSVYFPL